MLMPEKKQVTIYSYTSDKEREKLINTVIREREK